MLKFKNTKIEKQIITDGKPFPFVLDGQNKYLKKDFFEWVKEDKDSLKQLLLDHDAVLFRNFPIENPQDFENMLNTAEFPEMPYIGGAAPRTAVTGGRILTANESPATETIPFHHEMAQTPNPPSNIFFCCDIAAKKGGATSIIQSHLVQKSFSEIDSEFAKKIEEQGVKYIRVMPEETDKSSAIGRSWKETFQCNTKEEAEKKMKEIGTDWEWLENGDVKTTTSVIPAIRKDHMGRKTFFNSIVAVFTGWNDSRNIGEKAVISADGNYMKKDVIEALKKKIDEIAVAFKWQKGDVLWINNNTVLHARQPYEGPRKILASIAK